MKNASFQRTAAAFLALFCTVALSGDAAARGKRKPAKSKPTAAQRAALGELMGAFTFGMTKKQVLGKLNEQIRERYQAQISAVTSVYKQDELRKTRDKEIKRIKKSFTKFSGKRSGWDVSIVDDQFAHHTKESMLVHWENHEGKNQRRFFFFYKGKLYKMFIALDSSTLKANQRTFAFLQSLMERRFGSGNVEYRKDKSGVEHPDHISWGGRGLVVRAYDKLGFYGSFCLSISKPSVEKSLLALRAKNRPASRPDNVLDAVVTKEGEADEPTLDENSAAVDSIVGD